MCVPFGGKLDGADVHGQPRRGSLLRTWFARTVAQASLNVVVIDGTRSPSMARDSDVWWLSSELERIDQRSTEAWSGISRRICLLQSVDERDRKAQSLTRHDGTSPFPQLLTSRVEMLGGWKTSGRRQRSRLWSDITCGGSTTTSSIDSSDFVMTRSRVPPRRSVGTRGVCGMQSKQSRISFNLIMSESVGRSTWMLKSPAITTWHLYNATTSKYAVSSVKNLLLTSAEPGQLRYKKQVSCP